ncbi:hypothetical protein GH714_019241 [Hevea brasiliensis]|uniref:Uncharacterized protein n=1 Tax=Hevea brasiliensis TaxID=3981 RepID=A0A6A6MCN7_HEVBR|nr:hypothetical protein GH714_019241 [Hevea brasiliensis]
MLGKVSKDSTSERVTLSSTNDIMSTDTSIMGFLSSKLGEISPGFHFSSLLGNASLELWYFTAVILMVGWLDNPEIAVDAVSICMNLQLWALMIALGFNAAISVRVSNELGAGNPKVAKFSVVVTVLTSTIIGVVFTALILVTKTGKPAVMKEASKLGYFLAATIFLNSIQPVLHGVAVGLPIGAVLGYKINLGVKGIWSGMLAGCVLQIIILTFVFLRTNWNKEALKAEERIRTWGGFEEPQQSSSEHNMNE